jgi:hypothetical protein
MLRSSTARADLTGGGPASREGPATQSKETCRPGSESKGNHPEDYGLGEACRS